MNNKGFTLVELLAVIIILLGIAMVSVSNIISSLEKNDVQECEKQKEIIINAAKIYFSLNDETEVTVQTLIDNDYFKSSDVSKYNSDDKVTKNNGYNFEGTCSKS